jgi:nucleotidyltransferase/DNA polymerase involved in DNA repair
VGDLFLVGKKTAESLANIGIHIRTIGDIASYDKDSLVRRFGLSAKNIIGTDCAECRNYCGIHMVLFR